MSSVHVSTTSSPDVEASRKYTAARKRRHALDLTLRLIVIGIAMIFALFPVIWIASASVNPNNSLVGQRLVPEHASLANYNELLHSDVHPFLRWMWNSFKLASISSVLSVLVSALSAYAFSRFRFRGRRSMLLTVFLVQIFPNSLSMVATFLLIQQIGEYIPSLGLNSHGGLILVYLGGAMGINTWLMKGYFDSIPRELDESAMIDGASHWYTFWRIIMPLVRPVLAVVGVLSFVGTYGDYLFALLLVKDKDLYTLAVGMSIFIGDQFSQKWGVFAAGALLGAIPIVIIYLLLQDFIVSGLTQGAVKG
ncbi:MAG TPA: sugar ABC transporter permease [Aggregatilinea sp.]|uniref:sugar ABC transporter permease n=1 Tax=Aggregatilinea sp. TaxID=2806333 RepID=UPI002D0FFAAB|nr:sugar ABC transporter permease [Aggregatilinea sp.]HML20276.1 sugar ABC transporter permease [Aggregatilinea sp.]